MTKETKSDAPVKTFKDGRLKVSIWKNESDNGPFYSAVPARTYKDKQDNLQDGNSYTSSELLRIARLLTAAYDHIVRLRTQDKLDAQAAELDEPEQP